MPDTSQLDSSGQPRLLVWLYSYLPRATLSPLERYSAPTIQYTWQMHDSRISVWLQLSSCCVRSILVFNCQSIFYLTSAPNKPTVLLMLKSKSTQMPRKKDSYIT